MRVSVQITACLFVPGGLRFCGTRRGSAMEVSTFDPTGEEEKANYRSCGRFSEPLKPTARPSQLRQTTSVPSIPSRVETTLFKGWRERKGFGSHALRFDMAGSALDAELPGPGSYRLGKSFHEEMTERSSWGARGTGGFASRSKRFGTRSMPALPILGRGVPGPGNYEPVEAHEKLRRPRNFSQAKCSGAFAAPTEQVVLARVRASEPPAPGPGHYRQGLLPDERYVTAAYASFRSESRRSGGQPHSMDAVFTPGPGEYYEGSSPSRGARSFDDPSAVFREPTMRHFAPVHPDLPAADEHARGVLGDFADEVAKECLGTTAPKSLAALPGPGHYEQARDALDGSDRLASRCGSSSFQLGPGRYNPAPTSAGHMPGPGAYEPRKVAQAQVTSAVSAFLSLTERDFPIREVKRGPGPCFYKPESPIGKKSFILNSKKRWV